MDLTITAVVGVAMMNCASRLPCDKCQRHFCFGSPGRVEHFDINALVQNPPTHLLQLMTHGGSVGHRILSSTWKLDHKAKGFEAPSLCFACCAEIKGLRSRLSCLLYLNSHLTLHRFVCMPYVNFAYTARWKLNSTKFRTR